MAGHTVIHWSFAGHRTKAPPEEHVVLPSNLLAQADLLLAAANRTPKRQFPCQTAYATNLLRRDYFQVVWSEVVCAVGDFKDGVIVGGTAWTVQMFLDRFLDADLRRWLSEDRDVRTDPQIAIEILTFLDGAGVKTVALADRIIGCPHEEGIDYGGPTCPQCPYWAGRDRWTGEILH
jgi:hypothetical protein